MRQSGPQDRPNPDEGEPRSETNIPDIERSKPSRRLAIIDPSPLRRDYLKAGLAREAQLWRVDALASVTDLASLVRQGQNFTVVLLGSKTASAIHPLDVSRIVEAAPKTPILATAECDDPERARLILRSGAKGFLPASLGLKVLVAALERVRTGGRFEPLMLRSAKREPVSNEATEEPWRNVLTGRQRAVLMLISEGKSNKLIADTLTISESTVKAHVKQIMQRLQVANRTQAALIASQSRRHADANSAGGLTPLRRNGPEQRRAKVTEIRIPQMDLNFFREKAEHCRLLLTINTSPEVEQQLRLWEQEFDKLADQLEKRHLPRLGEP